MIFYIVLSRIKMSLSKILIGISFISVVVTFDILDKKRESFYKELDESYHKRFGRYPIFYWQENFPLKYWTRSRPGVYRKLLKIKNYDSTQRWLRRISADEFHFIKKLPLKQKKIIIRDMMINNYLFFSFIIFITIMFLLDGGLDYLLAPVTREDIIRGISRLN